MIDFRSWASVWWNWSVALTWQVAVLAVLVLTATTVFRKASPRFRHTLWLLVLVRVFVPPTLSAPWSLGNFLPAPERAIDVSPDAAVAAGAPLAGEPAGTQLVESTELWEYLFALWLAGVVISLGLVIFQYRRVLKKVRAFPLADEGPVKVVVEQAALALKVADPPDVCLSGEAESPFLIGVIRPVIVLPQTFAENAGSEELQLILQHEVAHWKHRDTWIGWFQVIVQSLMWFHPLIWFANSQLRHERETVCDAAVLQSGSVSPDDYGQTLLRVLTLARGRSLVAGSLVGVFERGARIQNRLETVMQFQSNRRRSELSACLGVFVFSMMFLPMAPSVSQKSQASVAAEESRPAAASREQDQATATQSAEKASKKPSTPWPQIVKTVPAAGSTDVDPGLKEIRVVFDRDMGAGMSWTGGGAEFPPVNQSVKARWTDRRTCVLPVQLKRGKYYRVGINSKSYQNFKAVNGKPTPPSAIFFTTRGASNALKNRVRIPKVVKLSPELNADGVSPSTPVLSVTFDLPMGKGMSWTGGGENFPTIAPGRKPEWSSDGRTCTLPVSLKADHSYQLGLNSLSHNNFQSKWGVPMKPMVYRFSTGAADQ